MSEALARTYGRWAGSAVETSTRHPWAVLALCLALTLGSIYVAVAILEIDPDADRILSPDLPVRQTNLALAEAFPGMQNNLVVMIEADDPDDARAAAEELADRLAASPERYPGVFLPGHDPFYDDFGIYYLERDELERLASRMEEAGPLLATLVERPELPILIGALNHAIGDVDGLSSLGGDGRRILERFAGAVEAFNRGERAPIPWSDLLFEDVAVEHPSSQLLFVRPAGDLTLMPPVLEALEEIRSLSRQLEPRPGLRVRVTGDRAVHTEEMSLVVGEAVITAVASLVLVTLILLHTLRSLRLLLSTLLTLLVGLTWTAGMAGLAVGGLNALTSAFAVVYIGLGVDFGIHFALGYLDRRRVGEPRLPALERTGHDVGGSLFLCALTTAIGFYSFIPTDYSGVADMGIISGTGVLLGLLATLTLYPALIALGLGESRATRPSRRFEIRLPAFPLRRPRTVCAVAALVTLVCAGAVLRVRFDSNTLEVRDPRVESVQALGTLLSDPERSVWTIDVLTRDLAEARALAPRLEALEGVDHVNILDSFLPEDQDERLAIFQRMTSDLTTPIELSETETGEGHDLPTALEITVEGYGVALDIDAELRGDSDEEAELVAASERLRTALQALLTRVDEDPSLDLTPLERDVVGDLAEVREDVLGALPPRTVTLEDLPIELRQRYLAPDGRARVEVFAATDLGEPGALEAFSDLVHSVRPDAGGPAAGTVALARAIVGSLRQALVTAIVVIALLLLFLWRSWKYTLITLAPLAIGSVATAAVSVWADLPFNFANVIVLPLILGIGVDSGIHLVHRHRTARPGDADLLSTATARAVFYSALTTVSSFSTLAFSNHLGIASLGKMLVAGVVLMLLANVVVLPAMLQIFDPRGPTPGGAGQTDASLSAPAWDP